MNRSLSHSRNQTRPVVFITGAAKRIGRALALDFAKRGWDIAVHYNNSQKDADELVRELERLGASAIALKGDLAQSHKVHELIEKCGSEFGRPACLINNASLFENDRIETMTSDGWDAHLNINLKSPVFLAQAFAKSLPEGDQGHIINIIDQKVHNLTPYFYSYTISKSALWTATQTLAQALAPNIRVNAIGPGPVLKSIHQTDEQFEKQYASTPLERGATPEEIASAVHFILDAPAMTGQIIMLDGGQHLSWKGRQKRNSDEK